MKDYRELQVWQPARIFHGATAPSPWFARQPQRGRCGSNKQSIVAYHSECEISRLGHALTLQIHATTKSFLEDELFGLTSQMRRAASSIPANIAEGCGRDADAELKRFPAIAPGSACESDYFILLSPELGYVATEVSQKIGGDSLRLRRQPGAFIRKLKA